MSISYRYLSLESAVASLDSVKRGEVSVSDELEKDDFHLRPFTDSGIKTERLLEARSLFFVELKTPSENTSDLTISFSEFDRIFTRSCSTIFHDMSPIDGFSREVWSYLTLRLLPDLALWRWNVNKTDERFLGGAERSCFQRLWLRSYVLGGDLASQLFEDEAVNIFERPEATHAYSVVSSSRSVQIYPVGSPKIISSNQSSYEALFKFQVMFPKDLTEKKELIFSTFAILENGNPELDPPPGVEVPKILGISLEGQLLSQTAAIELDQSMHMKYLEIAVSGPQGVGSTCRWKEVD